MTRTVDFATTADGLGLVRSPRRAVLDDPALAKQRLDAIEQLLKDLMAGLEEHGA